MFKIKTYLCIALFAGCFTQVARAQEAETETDEQATTVTTEEQEGADSADSFSLTPTTGREACPASLDVTYYIYSDYIFRGVNFSEYPGEGREKIDHQITTSLELDLGMLFGRERGELGTFGFGTFFEWYADQEILDPEFGNDNLQEIDYTLTWTYDIEQIATSFTLGYVFYDFPHHKPINTQEWTLGLAHNDAWMWKWLLPNNEDGVLNPTFFFAQDVDQIKGCWAEIGISHDFEVAEGLTITPSTLLAIDHRYLGPMTGTSENGSTRLAYIQYGLTAAYDLSQLYRIPHDPGQWTVAGFLYFNEALGHAKDSGAIGDEFFGGMSLSWSF